MSKGTGRQTQFDGESHRRLYEMIAQANPGTLMLQGTVLLQASSEIHKIAEDLKAHIDHVPWEGEGGESFRRWSHHMAGESAKLATYTGTAGYWLNQSGQALSEAQKMPRPNYVETEDVATNGITDSPLGTRNSDHEEAIRQLGKVASYYAVTQEYVTQQEKPNFRPMTGVPEMEKLYQEADVSPGATDSRTGVLPHLSGPPATAKPTMDHPEPELALPKRDNGTVSPPTATNPDPGTVLDSVAQDHRPDLPTPDRPRDTSPPSDAGQPAPHGQSGPPTGGQHGPSGRKSGGQPPLHAPSSRQPNVPQPSGSRPRDGVVGGTPLPKDTSTANQRSPRGVVMGEERTPTTRGPMGMGPGAPSASAPPGSPPAPGRRLANEPGGPVHANPRAPQRSSSDFTPGGSGLVRAHSGASGVPASPNSRRTTDERPDYLEEEEETWNGRKRNTIPPVIE